MTDTYTPNEQELIEGSTVSADERRRAIARIKADVLREALLSDESVERAAHGIHASHDRGDWEHEPAEVLNEYLNMARVALTAAIGDDDE